MWWLMIVKQVKPTQTEWTRVAFAELVFYYNSKQFHLFVCDLII